MGYMGLHGHSWDRRRPAGFVNRLSGAGGTPAVPGRAQKCNPKLNHAQNGEIAMNAVLMAVFFLYIDNRAIAGDIYAVSGYSGLICCHE